MKADIYDWVTGTWLGRAKWFEISGAKDGDVFVSRGRKVQILFTTDARGSER